MKIAVFAALAAMSLLAGCVSTRATVLDHNAVRTAIEPETVRLFRSADLVPGAYEEIALLNSRGDSIMTHERNMAESMRRRAAKLGANGVILDAMTEPHAAIQVMARVMGERTSRRGKAVAIFVHPQGGEAAQQVAYVAPQVAVPVAAPVAAPRYAAPRATAAVAAAPARSVLPAQPAPLRGPAAVIVPVAVQPAVPQPAAQAGGVTVVVQAPAQQTGSFLGDYSTLAAAPAAPQRSAVRYNCQRDPATGAFTLCTPVQPAR